MGNDRPNTKHRGFFGLRLRRWSVFILAFLGFIFLASQTDWRSLQNQRELKNFVYLICLLAIVAPLMLRGRLTQNLRHLAAWALLLLSLTYGYAAWRTDSLTLDKFTGALFPSRDSANLTGTAQFFANANGEFLVAGKVNEVEVIFLLDTGASDLVLSYRDAIRIGMTPENMVFSRVYQTANGTVSGAPVRLSAVTIGGVRLENVRASVTSGDLHLSLLGMSFLKRLSEFSVKGPVLKLYQ